MALKATRKKQESNSNLQSPLLESSNYPARVVQIIDLGLQSNTYKGETKTAHQAMITYEMGTEFMQDEDGNDVEDKPRWLSETINMIDLPIGKSPQEVYVDKYKSKAKMVQRAKTFDKDGELDFDFSQMLGSPCTLTVIQKVRKASGETKNDIGGVTPPMKGFTCPELVNPAKFFDLSEPDIEFFNGMPEWLREKIKGNLEYKGSVLESLLEGVQEPAKKAEPKPKVEDDDVPFDTDDNDDDGEW